MDRRLTWTDSDKAGDIVPYVLSPRDLVSRPDCTTHVTKKNHFLIIVPIIFLLVIPFSVSVEAIVYNGMGKMNDCLITSGCAGAVNDENDVALLCSFPSNISRTAISCRRCFML